MADKVAFATTNWKDKPNKPTGMSQGEWDAYNSSKFNGFPFATPEKNQLGQTFKEWDQFTYFELDDGRKIPSESSTDLVSVLGDHYSYVFTFDQLFDFFWKMKKSKIILSDLTFTPAPVKEEKLNSESSAFRERNIEIVREGIYGSNTTTIGEETKEIANESEIVTSFSIPVGDKEPKWQINLNFSKTIKPLPPVAGEVSCDGFQVNTGNIYSKGIESDECKVSIDFSQPVLKTGTDEYRPYIHCDCCFLSLCSDLLDCKTLTRFHKFQMDYTRVFYKNDLSDRPVADSILSCLRQRCYEGCPEENSEGGTERTDCINDCNDYWTTNPSWSHSRHERLGEPLNRYSACLKFVKVKVTKSSTEPDAPVEKEYTSICGETTITGKNIIEEILKPNVPNDLYDKPGCYIFKIEFFGYKAIELGWPPKPQTAWYGCDSKNKWISSDTSFTIDLSKKINPMRAEQE